jgi:glycosyltransferase involved in cell wall biosynthesis
LRVVHINTHDRTGGAARSAYRLHQGLRRIGLESSMYVEQRTCDDPQIYQYEPPRNLTIRLPRILRRKLLDRDLNRYRSTATVPLWYIADDRSPLGADPWEKIPPADLLHLHWIAKFLDYQEFFTCLPPSMPLVWTMHDMAPLTGGCHFSEGCDKFSQQCGACPLLGSHSQSDLTRKIWRRKNASLQSLDSAGLHIVTPSRWIQGLVKSSSLLSRFDSTVIPYGLDTDVFAPRDRRFARDILEIPQDSKVVLFVASGINDPRKGLNELVQVLSSLSTDHKLFFLSTGGGQLPRLQNLPHRHIQALDADGLLSSIYSAADIFVLPSLLDNLPNVVLESMSCGVPVAAFATGGIPDMVRPGISGFLAKRGDNDDLRKIICQLLQNDELRAQMSVNCRKIALQEYSLELQARRYADIYARMTGKQSSATQTGQRQANGTPP